MIRSKNKIYGEPNDPNTVLVESDLVANKYVVSAGGKQIKPFNPGPKRIMITDADGKASSFDHNQANKWVGTNQNGQLTLFNPIPTTIPTGRTLIAEIMGSSLPESVLSQLSVNLSAPFWYEVEVVGAGGGGGGGIGSYASGAEITNGLNGGRGGYYKGLFLLLNPATALLQAGNGGAAANARTYYRSGGSILSVGNNQGGAGGRTPIKFTLKGNSGADPVYDNIGYSGPSPVAGGLGINGGAKGGDVRSDTVGYAKGIGGSGGGANGGFGGNGGNSFVYNTNSAIIGGSGGGGGAGGGFGTGGSGGGIAPDKPVSYGGGGGGTGIHDGSTDYGFSAGGGGGGGGSRFACAEVEILCGGGGGGAGAGDGTSNTSTPGSNGTNNMDGVYSTNPVDNAGRGGTGFNLTSPLTIHDCKGTNGQGGYVRLWRCV